MRVRMASVVLVYGFNTTPLKVQCIKEATVAATKLVRLKHSTSVRQSANPTLCVARPWAYRFLGLRHLALGRGIPGEDRFV